MATRRTHVVRISDAKEGDPPSANYVDVEVLDALAFRTDNGQEVILNFDKDNIVPYIDDDTGGKQEKHPGADSATRRSHMKRITSKDGKKFFDAEILDCCAFRDQNGNEWILDLPSSKSSHFNTTAGGDGGSGEPTMRTHNEKVSPDRSKNPTEYVTVERTDMVAFRTINGNEMIIKMPSNDDPNVSDPRADTFITPSGYDPAKDDVVPPPNKDKNVYIHFPKDGSVFTGDEKVSQGMLWWIRKVSGLRILVLESKCAHNGAQLSYTASIAGIDFDPLGSGAVFSPQSAPINNHPMTAAMLSNYYVWCAGSGAPKETDNRAPNDGLLVTRNLTFLNLEKIQSKLGEGATEFELTINTPAQGADHDGVADPVTVWYVWGVGDDFPGNPDLPGIDGVNPAMFGNSIAFEAVFPTEAQANKYASNRYDVVGVYPWVINGTTVTGDNVQWSFRASSYKGHQDFPTNDAVDQYSTLAPFGGDTPTPPVLDPPIEPEGNDTVTSSPGGEGKPHLPAAKVTFKIDIKTLKITGAVDPSGAGIDGGGGASGATGP